jgi:hypothetical protein
MLAIAFKNEREAMKDKKGMLRSEHLPQCGRFLKMTSFCNEPDTFGA